MHRTLTLLLGLVSLVPAWGRDAKDPDPEPPAKKFIFAIKTNHGTIKVELYPDKAPVTVKNFAGYVDKKFYDGLVFHRVIDNFMIQAGGYKKGLAAGQQQPGAMEKKGGKGIKCESDNGLSNRRGTIAMARARDPESGTTQFFINVKGNDYLDRAKAHDKVGYCVFGKVITGMDVVDKIKGVKTKSVGELNDVPAEDVVIESIRRVSR